MVTSRLINKSVRGTVDLRALTKTPPPSASRADKEEALEENMTLVVESARAIGCSVNERTEGNLIKGDQETIKSFLIQLIRVSQIHCIITICAILFAYACSSVFVCWHLKYFLFDHMTIIISAIFNKVYRTYSC